MDRAEVFTKGKLAPIGRAYARCHTLLGRLAPSIADRAGVGGALIDTLKLHDDLIDMRIINLNPFGFLFCVRPCR